MKCWLVVGAWLLLVGCGASASTAPAADARSAEAKREVLASFERACDLRAKHGPPPAAAPLPPELLPVPPPASSHGPVLPSLFLETALFTAPASSVGGSPDVRRALAGEPRARLIAGPHVALEFEQRSRVAFEDHTGPLAYTAFRALEATAKLAGEGRVALELDVDLQLPTATNAPSTPVPTTRVRFALGVPLQTPVTATAPVPGRTDEVAVLVFSAYLIREEGDLRTLFECKMRERQRRVAGVSD